MKARRNILQMLAKTQHHPLRLRRHGVISGEQSNESKQHQQNSPDRRGLSGRQ